MKQNLTAYFPELLVPVVSADDNPYYVFAMQQLINTVVSEPLLIELFKQKPEAREKTLLSHLPIVLTSSFQKPPFNLSFFLFCPFRSNAYRFFYELVSRWLLPGKVGNVLLQFAVDFKIPSLGDLSYIGGEVVIQVETSKELEQIRSNLPLLMTEIKVGVASSYQANRILEIKGLTGDEKTSLIQENIASLIKHRPQDFDFDIFSEMQHFLVMCKSSFKAARSFKHMSRIICVHYLFRKALAHSQEAFPERRYFSIKLIRTKILEGRKERRVLGLIIALSFLKENECFEQKHILNAVATVGFAVKVVAGSYFTNTSRAETANTYYLEIEKRDETPFSLEECRLLKGELPSALGRCIERRVSPVFMPQNEEEIMRHVVRLSKELRLVRDIPQVVISFERQTEGELEFLVILLRVVKEGAPSFQTLFDQSITMLSFCSNRVKIVGMIRRKYKKEANVFKLSLKKRRYLRHDRSVDLYKARAELVSELSKVIGEFRDFNGGMLSKEGQLFSTLCHDLKEVAQENAFLLENFFYTLTPPVMRSLLPVEHLKKLFTMLLESGRESFPSEERVLFKVDQNKDALFIVLVGEDPGFKEEVDNAISKLHLPHIKCASTFLYVSDHPCMGIVYRSSTEEERKTFQHTIEGTLSSWQSNYQVSTFC